MDTNIYNQQDPINVPAYSVRQVAHFLKLPLATVRAWTLGRSYRVGSGKRLSDPLIPVADTGGHSFSFRNVIEIHVLSALRRKHKIEMLKVRAAINYLSEKLAVSRPLSDQQMLTDGCDLFVEQYGNLINLIRKGQLEMRSLVGVYLSRIERDPSGLPAKFFPFTRPEVIDAPTSIVLNPRVQFGRPCINGSGIPTAVVVERYVAGETPEALANDYRLPLDSINEAIRFEYVASAA